MKAVGSFLKDGGYSLTASPVAAKAMQDSHYMVSVI